MQNFNANAGALPATQNHGNVVINGITVEPDVVKTVETMLRAPLHTVHPDNLRAVIQNARHLGQGHPIPPTVASNISNRNDPRFYYDLWQSWSGLNLKKSEMFLTQINQRGTWILDQFDIKNWHEIEQMDNYRIEGNKIKTTSWTISTGVLDEVSPRALTSAIRPEMNASSQTLQHYNHPIFMPSNFLDDPIKVNMFDMQFKAASVSCARTIMLNIITTLLGFGLCNSYDRIRKKLPMSANDFQHFTRRRNHGAFLFAKDGSSLRGLESDVLNEMAPRVPTTILTTSRSMRFLTLDVPMDRNHFQSQGELIDDGVNMNLAGFSPLRRFEVYESVPFNRLNSNTTFDPLEHEMFVPQIFIMSEGENPHTLSHHYRSDSRAIRIHDAESRKWVEIKLDQALRYCGLFEADNPMEISNIGRRLLLRLAEKAYYTENQSSALSAAHLTQGKSGTIGLQQRHEIRRRQRALDNTGNYSEETMSAAAAQGIDAGLDDGLDSSDGEGDNDDDDDDDRDDQGDDDDDDDGGRYADGNRRGVTDTLAQARFLSNAIRDVSDENKRITQSIAVRKEKVILRLFRANDKTPGYKRRKDFDYDLFETDFKTALHSQFGSRMCPLDSLPWGVNLLTMLRAANIVSPFCKLLLSGHRANALHCLMEEYLLQNHAATAERVRHLNKEQEESNQRQRRREYSVTSRAPTVTDTLYATNNTRFTSGGQGAAQKPGLPSKLPVPGGRAQLKPIHSLSSLFVYPLMSPKVKSMYETNAAFKADTCAVFGSKFIDFFNGLGDQDKANIDELTRLIAGARVEFDKANAGEQTIIDALRDYVTQNNDALRKFMPAMARGGQHVYSVQDVSWFVLLNLFMYIARDVIASMFDAMDDTQANKSTRETAFSFDQNTYDTLFSTKMYDANTTPFAIAYHNNIGTGEVNKIKAVLLADKADFFKTYRTWVRIAKVISTLFMQPIKAKQTYTQKHDKHMQAFVINELLPSVESLFTAMDTSGSSKIDMTDDAQFDKTLSAFITSSFAFTPSLAVLRNINVASAASAWVAMPAGKAAKFDWKPVFAGVTTTEPVMILKSLADSFDLSYETFTERLQQSFENYYEVHTNNPGKIIYNTYLLLMGAMRAWRNGSISAMFLKKLQVIYSVMLLQPTEAPPVETTPFIENMASVDDTQMAAKEDAKINALWVPYVQTPKFVKSVNAHLKDSPFMSNVMHVQEQLQRERKSDVDRINGKRKRDNGSGAADDDYTDPTIDDVLRRPSAKKKFDIHRLVPYTRNTLERLLMRLRMTRRVWNLLIEEDLFFPASFIAWRTIQMRAGCTLFYIKGSSTGVVCVRNCAVKYAQSIHTEEIEIKISFSATLLVHQPKNIEFVPDTTPVLYVSGGGVEPYDLKLDANAYSKRNFNRDILYTVVPYDFVCKSDSLPLPGVMPSALVMPDASASSKERKMLWPTADIYRAQLSIPDADCLKDDEDMFSPTFYNKATKGSMQIFFRSGFEQLEQDRSARDESCIWTKVAGLDAFGEMPKISDFDTLSHNNKAGGSGIRTQSRF